MEFQANAAGPEWALQRELALCCESARLSAFQAACVLWHSRELQPQEIVGRLKAAGVDADLHAVECALEQAAAKVGRINLDMRRYGWQPGWMVRECYRNVRRCNPLPGPEPDTTYPKVYALRGPVMEPGGVLLELSATQQLRELARRLDCLDRVGL